MNILITGENGYISNEIYKYLNDYHDILKQSVRNEEIKDIDFTRFDVVIHTAAIVHKKESHLSEIEYKKINTELTKILASKAKNAGVKQFIFFSTMAVFGDVQGEINLDTELEPISYYGKSKLEAEKCLQQLEDENFKVAIVRPPMVYGPNCPGNYALLRKLSLKTPIFPRIENRRSMIFIGNLVNFIEQLIVNNDSGVFHPQDPQFVDTSNLVKEIAKLNKKKVITTKVGAFLLRLVIGKSNIYNKVFGNLVYHKDFSIYRENIYQQFNVLSAIQKTEKEYKK